MDKGELIRALRKQRLHELNLLLTIRDAAHGVFEAVHRIRDATFPVSRRPMQRGEAGLEDIGIRALLEQEQRERHMPAYGRHEQRRASRGERRLIGRASWRTRSRRRA